MADTESTAPTSRSASPSTLLAHDLDDLHDFAKRKRHFDNFTDKLHALPVITPYAEPLAVTQDQLTTWLADHAAIEQEVDDFDKGDLDKWRRLARGARPACLVEYAHAPLQPLRTRRCPRRIPTLSNSSYRPCSPSTSS